MEIIGNAINYLRRRNKSFILFSPDEAESNRLSTVIAKNGIREILNGNLPFLYILMEGLLKF